MSTENGDAATEPAELVGALRAAAANGAADRVGALLDELLAAAGGGAAFHRLLERGPPGPRAAVTEDSKRSLLHLAVLNNRWRVAELLLRRGAAGVDERDRRRRTALHWAADCGHARVVGVLLAHGAGVSAPDGEAMPPLLLAAASGHLEVVQLLTTAGAGLHASDAMGATAMHWAALNGHAEVVTTLGRLGCRWNAEDLRGRTPLAHVQLAERFARADQGSGGGESDAVRRALYAAGRLQGAAVEGTPALAALQRFALACGLHRRLGAGCAFYSGGEAVSAAVASVGCELLVAAGGRSSPEAAVPLWLRHGAQEAPAAGRRDAAAAQARLAAAIAELADSDVSSGEEERRERADAECRGEESAIAAAASELAATAGGAAVEAAAARRRKRRRDCRPYDPGDPDGVDEFIAFGHSDEDGWGSEDGAAPPDELDRAEAALRRRRRSRTAAGGGGQGRQYAEQEREKYSFSAQGAARLGARRGRVGGSKGRRRTPVAPRPRRLLDSDSDESG
jgi:hypothetical protein